MATGPKGAVKHLVILVQENHTTNNYFRSLGAYGANVATDWPLAPGPSWRNEEHHRHDQTTSNQEHELRRAAERASWQVAKVYNDHGISGAKGRNGRPAFDALCRAFLSELHALGIDLFLHQQGLDTTTPAGKAMFQCWASLPSSNAR